MSALASQITSLTIAYSTVYSSADQRKHQTPRPWPVNSPHKWPVTWKMFPFDGVIMRSQKHRGVHGHDSNCLFAQRNKCFRHNNFQAWSEDKHIALATFRINDRWNEDVVIFTKKNFITGCTYMESCNFDIFQYSQNGDIVVSVMACSAAKNIRINADFFPVEPKKQVKWNVDINGFNACESTTCGNGNHYNKPIL